MTGWTQPRHAVVAALLLAASVTLGANGSEFFASNPENGPINLMYVGRVKNARTGRHVTEYPYVTITDHMTGMIIPFTGDSPGHFRSPDIGAALRELAGGDVDPGKIEIEVLVTGYRKARLTRAPRQKSGLVALNFELEPEAGAGVATGAASRPLAVPPPSPDAERASQNAWRVLIGGVTLVAMASLVWTMIRRVSERRAAVSSSS